MHLHQQGRKVWGTVTYKDGSLTGTLEGDVMRLEELHRFPTPLIERNRHLYWDVETMWSEIRSAVAKAFDTGVAIRSISVDSWAVDYVPLDLHGAALRRPYSYRDPRTYSRRAH